MNSPSSAFITVRLFGPQAVLAGARELAVHAPDGCTARDLLEALGKADPRLAPSLPYSRIAVNFEFVAGDAPVNPSDEVALIGMLSGG